MVEDQAAQRRHSESPVVEDQAAQRRQIGSAKLAQQTEQLNTLRSNIIVISDCSCTGLPTKNKITNTNLQEFLESFFLHLWFPRFFLD